MQQKITIIGNPKQGKTTMLRILIYLYISDSRFKSIECYEPNKGELVLRKGTPINKSALFYNGVINISELNKIFDKYADIRTVITLQESDGDEPKYISISTVGDNSEEVRLNWFMFNEKFRSNKNDRVDFEVCVSPCHKNDNSMDQEQLEFRWRLNTKSNKLETIFEHHEYLIDNNKCHLGSTNSLANEINEVVYKVLLNKKLTTAQIYSAVNRALNLKQIINL